MLKECPEQFSMKVLIQLSSLIVRALFSGHRMHSVWVFMEGKEVNFTFPRGQWAEDRGCLLPRGDSRQDPFPLDKLSPQV